MLHSNGFILHNASIDISFPDISSLQINEFPFFILELKSGKIGTHSFTDAGVSSSINFINKENLLTSTA